jgi:hypothetical protein
MQQIDYISAQLSKGRFAVWPARFSLYYFFFRFVSVPLGDIRS